MSEYRAVKSVRYFYGLSGRPDRIQRMAISLSTYFIFLPPLPCDSSVAGNAPEAIARLTRPIWQRHKVRTSSTVSQGSPGGVGGLYS